MSRRIIATTKDYVFQSNPTLHAFPVAVKSRWPSWPVLFFYIVFVELVLFWI